MRPKIEKKLNIIGFKYGLVYAYIIYFILNFLGYSLLKHGYAILLIMHVCLIIFFSPEEAIPAMIALSFIEGQGRVIWGYNPIFRIVFDFCLFFIVAKIIIIRRRLLEISVIPVAIRACILMHFGWFFLEMFNFYGAGPMASLATGKYFIFPFLLFFSFSLLDLSNKHFMDRRVSVIVTILVVASACLCIYQMSQGEKLMFKISGNYQNLFAKYKNFTDSQFRPWGTSHSPGGQATFMYLTLGFVFICLGHLKAKIKHPIFIGIIGLSWFMLFVCNVRSALIKHVLIFLGCTFVYFLSSYRKFMSFRNTIISVLILIFLSPFFWDKIVKQAETLNLEEAKARYALLATEKVTSHRAGYDKILIRLQKDVPWPFGFGLGMAGAFLPEFEARRRELVGIPDYVFWHNDNIFVFLGLELGIGGVFYVLVVVLNLGHLIQMSMRLYARDQRYSFQIVGISTVNVIVITLGQWGVVGLPFNPESLFYWLWVAIGFVEYNNAQKEWVVITDPLNKPKGYETEREKALKLHLKT